MKKLLFLLIILYIGCGGFKGSRMTAQDLNLSAQRPLYSTGVNPELIRGQASANIGLNQQLGKTNVNVGAHFPQGSNPIYSAGLNTGGKMGSLGVQGNYNMNLRELGMDPLSINAQARLNIAKNLSGNLGASYQGGQISPSAGLSYRKRF